MNSKLKITALAVLMSASSLNAFAGNSVDFTTSIQVIVADACAIDVSALDKTGWGLNWQLADASATSGSLTPVDDSGVEPLFVKVKLQDGAAASCNLGQMKFCATISGAEVAEADKGTFKKATLHDGFWRFMPVVSQLKLFTDVNGADNNSGAIALENVKVTDATGTEHTQSATPLNNAKTVQNDVAGFNNKAAMTLTNNYLTDKGVAPLSTGTGGVLSYSLTEALDEGVAVKSALIGVGAIVAQDPEDKSGDIKLDAVDDGETIKLPFTVNVTLS